MQPTNNPTPEPGFLEQSTLFYYHLGAYALQQVLQERFKEQYGSQAPQILSAHMQALIQTGNDNANLCQYHQQHFGTLSFSEQIRNMDISLCSTLLLQNTNLLKMPLLTKEEREVIKAIRHERNESAHTINTQLSLEENNRIRWETGRDKLKDFENTPSLAKYISQDMKPIFANYYLGRGTYLPPSQTVIDTFKRLFKQNQTSAFHYAFDYASSSLLRDIYKEHSLAVDAYLAPTSSGYLRGEKRLEELSHLNYTYAMRYANRLPEKEKFAYLERCANYHWTSHALSIYKTLYVQNNNPTDRRRYDRGCLLLDPVVKERCLLELSEHKNDLIKMSAKEWRTRHERWHCVDLDPILSLMSEEDRAYFTKLERNSWLAQWDNILDKPLEQQLHWYFQKTHHEPSKPAIAKQIYNEIYDSISASYWKEKLRLLNSHAAAENYFRTYETRENSFRKNSLAYATWENAVKTREANKKLQSSHFLFKKNMEKAQQLLIGAKKDLQRVDAMKLSEQKIQNLESLSKQYKQFRDFLAPNSVAKETLVQESSNALIDTTLSKEVMHTLQDFENLQKSYEKMCDLSKHTENSLQTSKLLLQKRKKQGNKLRICMAWCCIVALIGTIIGFVLHAYTSKQKEADALYEQGKLIEAYTLYDKYSKFDKNMEKQRLQCLNRIRQTLLDNGFDSECGDLSVPSGANLIENVQASEIADYENSLCYVLHDGRCLSNEIWLDGNDWVFFDHLSYPLSVYDTIIAEWLS